jgi:thiol-disulfide isomerase/thioredoxin
MASLSLMHDCARLPCSSRASSPPSADSCLRLTALTNRHRSSLTCSSLQAPGRVPGSRHTLKAVGGIEGTRLPTDFEALMSQEDMDAVLKEASQKNQLVLVEWMAQWCRKCIYLKPKIEKLVHEFPDVRFCVVDVNNVPYTFVKSSNVSKMPTLQLWSGGKQVEELIAGEAAWQVLDKVREMIKRYSRK